MKKIIICSLMLIIEITAFSQQNEPSPTLTRQDYLQKSRHQKTIGWIFLGGGILTTALGTVKSNPNNIGSGDNSRSAVFLVTGLALVGTSIPFFIASSKNKRKAMSLSFIKESAPQLQKGSFVYKTIPSLKLKISL